MFLETYMCHLPVLPEAIEIVEDIGLKAIIAGNR